MLAAGQDVNSNEFAIVGNERGQSMAEFIIVLPLMLLLIFGAIQFALIFHAKITLNYAAFEAARAGSLGNADFKEVKEGFARGLAPLYSFSDANRDQVGAFQQARKQVLALFDGKKSLVRIERLNPNAARGEIPNDNLLYRKANSTGHGESIQDANILHLRVTYWHPLHVPFMNKIISSLVCCRQGENCRWQDDPACDSTDPRIPLTAVAAVRMQSPARQSVGFSKAQSR